MEKSKTIPCLPGYACNVQIRHDFRKRQHFDNKRIIEAVPFAAIDFNQPSEPFRQAQLQSTENADKFVPKWMKNMKLVARFFMYEVDKRFSRKFVLYFYLEDDSISIGEMPDYSRLSSGPPPHQALFLRRHRVANPDVGREYILTDFSIGKIVEIYGRTFHIYSCDQHTRDWFVENYGIELPASEPEPENNLFPVSHPEPLIPRDQRLFNPANAGHPTVEQLNASRKFLQDDGVVLRFWVRVSPSDQSLIWDEQDGRVKAIMMKSEDPIYVMRHFVVDETTELVLDKTYRQNGRGYPTTLIRRCVWPLELDGLSISNIGVSNSKNITLDDLQLGKIITAFGRRILLMRADTFTSTKLRLQHPVEEIIEGYVAPKRTIVEKPQKKLTDNPAAILRALAIIQTQGKLDHDRRFVIEYYTGDESVAVFEQSSRHSRKFLERTSKYKGDEFRVEDLQADRICTINKFQFVIIETDDSTKRWLQKLSV